VFVSIGDTRAYLRPAVNDGGEVLEDLVQSRRNKKSALKPIRELLKKRSFSPNANVTDQPPSYGAAPGTWGFPDVIILATGRTIGPRTPNNLFDDENEGCNGSSQPIQPNDFSRFTPRSTTFSTHAVT
jgi:hypothetical protein